jgi:hypothetical protein
MRNDSQERPIHTGVTGLPLIDSQRGARERLGGHSSVGIAVGAFADNMTLTVPKGRASGRVTRRPGKRGQGGQSSGKGGKGDSLPKQGAGSRQGLLPGAPADPDVPN